MEGWGGLNGRFSITFPVLYPEKGSLVNVLKFQTLYSILFFQLNSAFYVVISL